MRIKITSLLFILFFGLLHGQTNRNFETILEGTPIYDICSDGTFLWIASNGSGVYKLDPKSNKLENYSTGNGAVTHDMFYCIEANENYVWAGSTDGLFSFDKKSGQWTSRKFAKGAPLGNWIRSLALDKKENILWIGRFMYLTRFNLRTRQYDDFDLTIKGNAKTNNIKKVSVDGDSLIWFGTEGGLHKYNKKKSINSPGSIMFYDSKFNYFNGDGEQVSITSLLFERNNIWIGLDEFITPDNPQFNIGGLYRYDRRNDWKRFDASSGFAGNGIFCLERTGNFIWAGLYQFGQTSKESYGRGIALINRLTGKVRVINDPAIPSTVYCMYFDGNIMWLGTGNGIVKIPVTNKFAFFSKGN